jgi:hypothetical protein
MKVFTLSTNSILRGVFLEKFIVILSWKEIICVYGNLKSVTVLTKAFY